MAKSKIATPSSASKVFVFILIGAGLALFIGLAAGAFGTAKSETDIRNDLVKDGHPQAVYLSDGKVITGNIAFEGDIVEVRHDGNGETVSIDDVTYVNYQHVLYWENLEDDSIVTTPVIDNGDGE